MSGFETFTHAPRTSTRPTITIIRRGNLSINDVAYDQMGRPDAVELLFDAQRRILGLNPVEVHVPHAYPVRRPGPGARTRLIAGTAFTRHYGIDTDVSRRWTANLDEDGVLYIDMRIEGVQVTSDRRKITVPSLDSSVVGIRAIGLAD